MERERVMLGEYLPARLNSSLIAIAAAMVAGQPALAQDNATIAPPPQGSQSVADSDIIVTGSAIRGVEPVGSTLNSVGQDTIEKTAPSTVSHAYKPLTTLFTAGSGTQGQNP